jgi:hypothetical protein
MSAVPTEPMSSPTPERRPFRPGPGPMILRIAIIAVGLLIGIVLLSRGDIVLGMLILLFAVLRLVATLAMHRRRKDRRRQFETRRGARASR